MNLTLHDTMTGAKRPFVPRDPQRVTMYVCGPTVYNYSHIGNFRPVVAFDLLFRVLRHIYGEGAVIYAANITDVDDKINAKAAAEGVPISVITNRYLEAYHADSAALGALPPSFEPRATETIDAIIAMIGRLVANNAAYAAEGHVLFNIEAYAGYGELSGRTLDDMIAGARVEVAPYKRHPADFVLWKPSKPGEPEWPSRWGPGRPGWHIECSAMIEQTLGLPIDIHGGGIDLVFPHHENERAQGLCADHAESYSNYWLHNGFLTFGEEKMSKSLGNVVLAHDLVTKVPGEAVRWALLSGHYRQPLDWTGELLEQARNTLNRLYGVLKSASDRESDLQAAGIQLPPARPYIVEDLWKQSDFFPALMDDLNTPRAFAGIAAMANGVVGQLMLGETMNVQALSDQVSALRSAGQLMGFLQDTPKTWFEHGADDELKERVDALLKTRAEARQAKDWATADRIRGELDELNVVVMDNPDGATWRLK